MANELDGSLRDRGGPNGRFTIFHGFVLAMIVLAIVMPARDGYRDGGLRGLLLGLGGGVFIVAPFALVLSTACMAALIAVIVGSLWLVARLTGQEIQVPSEVPGTPAGPPHRGDEGP